jgi:hypothetical protein
MVLKHNAQKHEYNLLKKNLENYKTQLNGFKDNNKLCKKQIKELSSIDTLTKIEYNVLKKKKNNNYSDKNYISFLEKKIRNIETLMS